MDLTGEDLQRMLSINVFGVFYGLKHQIPVMERAYAETGRGGAILNVASAAGLIGAPLLSAYAASKHAVVGIDRRRSSGRGLSGPTLQTPSINRAAIPPACARVRGRTAGGVDRAHGSLTAGRDDPSAGPPRETNMTQSLQQKVISGLAALTIGVGVLAAAAPAQAKPWHHHHHGGAIAAGVIGGLALGALAASAAQPVYAAPVYAGPACYRAKQPVTDVFGNVLYYQTVKVCH